MSGPIAIFICYKKLSQQKQGRTILQRENLKAGILHAILQRDRERYDPWIDNLRLPPGIVWEMAIYRRILVTDVLIALISHGTSESPWVRREIALAKALGITIVPLGVDLKLDELNEELKKLEIADLQGKVLDDVREDAADIVLSDLRVALETARDKTRAQQGAELRDLLARLVPAPPPKAPDKQRAASFDLEVGRRSIKLHVASGDLAKVKGIDVLVNSENDYMQMARFFEGRSVSSMLRRRGAHTEDGRYRDTIQQELDWQIGNRARPVAPAEVFATSAGHPQSKLARENRCRYIFHVAAVEASEAILGVLPYKQDEQIEDCAKGSLAKLAEINRLKGVISQPGTAQRAEQEKLAREGKGIARSIMFPLFGTGQGGKAAAEVVLLMLDGIIGFLDDPDNAELCGVLTDIYLSVYRKTDVNDVVTLLQERVG
jgi:O-acetyl-ADP-ribose deacetylase (regulator of RNase III)